MGLVLHVHSNGNAWSGCPYEGSEKYHNWDKVKQNHNPDTSQRKNILADLVTAQSVLFSPNGLGFLLVTVWKMWTYYVVAILVACQQLQLLEVEQTSWLFDSNGVIHTALFVLEHVIQEMVSHFLVLLDNDDNFHAKSLDLWHDNVAFHLVYSLIHVLHQ